MRPQHRRLLNRLSGIFAGVFLVVCACSENNLNDPNSALPLVHNSIQMKVGDTWLYKRTLVASGISAYIDFPDTLVGYSFFRATKDTVMDLKTYLIVEGRDYEVDKDSITVFNKRVAIHFSDSGTSLYEFRTNGYGFGSGVLKDATAECRLTKSNYGATMLEKLHLRKLMAAAGYDTTVYSDFVYPILFPLVPDSIYTYRDYGDPNGNGFYRRKFLGVVPVSVPVGNFYAYKIEWLVKESMGVDSVYGFDWIGENGLLKRYWDYGNSVLSDSMGSPMGTFHTYDIMEKIGYKDIDPGTLVPWGKR